MCSHVQYTLFEQSITVTNINDDTCPFFSKFQPFFFSLSQFPVDELCCRSLKREGDSCDSSHSDLFQGFVDILMKPFFLLLTVMLCCWS